MSKNESVALRILEEFRVGVIRRRQAADLLGCSERAVSRRVKKLRSKGVEGIKHGNYQKPAVNKVDETLREKMLQLESEKYFDFNMSHCLEMLEERHGLKVSYSTFQRWCRKAGIAKRKKRRTSKARVCRERMASEGLLLQMDGSHHAWNGKDKWCLIALIDDATYENLDNIFCIKFERQVRSDNTVTFENQIYKILDRQYGSLKKKDVTVHVYKDITIAMYYGHIKLEHELVILPKRRWTKSIAQRKACLWTKR